MSHVNTVHTLTTHFFGKAWNENYAALILRPVMMYCDYACLTSTLILSSNLRLDLPSFLLSSYFLIKGLYLISETYRLKRKAYTNQHRHHIIEVHISEWTAVPGRDSAAGTATRYGLDGPRKESRWRRDIPCRPDQAQSPLSFWYNG